MKNKQIHSENVVIIGSGIGGLTTGIMLAGLGFNVAIAEKNPLPGGLMRSYIRNGTDCEVGIHYLGALDKGQILHRFFDYMGVSDQIPIERMGKDGVIDRYIFNSDVIGLEQFDMPSGIDEYENNLLSAFPGQKKQIHFLMKQLRGMAEKLHSPEFLSPAEQSGFSFFEESEPLGEILTKMNCSPGLRAVLGVPCAWLGVPLEDVPCFYHNMFLASYLFSSWRLKCTGSYMADIFTERFKSLGGKIILNEPVQEVLVSSRVVQGIRLKSGEIIKAELVIGAIHPKILLNMLPEGAVKHSYKKRISQLEDTKGIFSVQAETDAASHPAIPYNIFNVHSDTKGNISDMKFYQIRNTRKPDKNLLSILASGKDHLWQKWENTKTGNRGDDYKAAKREEAFCLIQEAETIFGDLKDINLTDVYTPLTIRDYVNSPNGSAYGVLRSSRQMLSAALLNRTSVKGLFLSGQSVMAPGIIGTIIGTFSTVRFIIGDEEFRDSVISRL